MKFKIIAVVTNHNVLLCSVTLGRVNGRYLCFEGKNCFHLQDELVVQVY